MKSPMSRVENVLNDLESMEGEVKLRAVRTMKNSVIGNRIKKKIYVGLGAIPLYVITIQYYLILNLITLDLFLF